MKVTKVNKTSVSSSLHLRNLFVSDSYLELGIVDTEIISSILKYEMVKLSDVTYFKVQNKGLGHSDIESDMLKNYVPHLFFMHLARNHPYCQLYISYGLLRYRGVEHKESFMPVILIPIKLYFENLESEDGEQEITSLNELFVQMITTPIINPSLYQVIGASKLNFVMTEELQTIEGLDYILTQLNKFEEYNLSLDNYITFSMNKSNDTIYPRRKRSNTQYKSTVGIDKLYRINPQVYMQRVYDKDQRLFIERFNNGEDLTLTGLNGCGKTSIIKDVLVNNLQKGLRTLYVSDNEESINDIYDFLIKTNLDRYTANFTQSFKKLSTHTYNPLFLDDVTETNEYIKTLNEYYDKLDRYEQDFNQSYRDFKLSEIIIGYFSSNRSLIKDKNYIDSLTEIYKHEYEIIYQSIKSLERNTQNIGSFQNSIWNAIPIVNSIKHINQVLGVVRNLNDDFKKLRTLEIKLNEFGVKGAESFSKLKTLNEPIYVVGKELIPVEWQKSLDVYKEAIDNFGNIENDITDYHNILDDINNNYNNLLNIDNKNEIKLLYGDFYKKSDAKHINDILSDENIIKHAIIEGRISINDFRKEANELIELLDWDFLTKDEYFNVIMDLNKVFNDYYLNGRMINVIINNKVEDDIQELNRLNQNILTLEDEMRMLEKIEPRLLGLNFDKKNIVYENDEFRTYDAKYKKSKRLIKEYIDICGVSHKYHSNNVGAIVSLKNFFESIKSKRYRKIIVEFMQEIDEDGYILFLVRSNVLKRAYFEVYRIIDSFSYYSYKPLSSSILDNVNRLNEYLDYIESLFSSNNRIKDCLIDKDTKYASVDIYYEMEKYIDRYNDKIKYFVNNKLYRDYFGYMYRYEKTDIQELKNVATIYNNYINVFVSTESVYESFVNYDNLRKIVNNTKEQLDSIVENIKQYSLIFKDSVKRYYDSKIEDNVVYFTKLLDCKNELNLYLNITSEIGVLNEYHLTNLIKYVEKNDDITGLSDIFEAYYFKNLVDKFFEKRGYLFKTDEFFELLEKTRSLEDIVCQCNAKKMINNYIKRNPVNIKHTNYDNYDYESFLLNNNRRLKIFLSDVSFATKHAKIINYDCVIIDDAHIISYGDCNTLFKNKRYIIAGDYQTNKSLNTNLISSLSEIDVTLRNRYELGPRNLTLEYPFKAPFLNSHKANIGVEAFNGDIYNYIYKLYKDDNKIKINYFIKNIDFQKETYENITKAFLYNNVNEYDIFDFLNNNLCIVDINSRNYNKSDYNILYLKDYYKEESIVATNNIYSTLTLAHKKLVIFDDANILNTKNENDAEILTKIKQLIKNNNPYLKNIIDHNLTKIEKEFDKFNANYKFRYPGNGVNMIIEKENGEFILNVCLFSNGNVTDILSTYRLMYEQYVAKNEKVVFTSLIDLIEKDETYASKIYKKITKL